MMIPLVFSLQFGFRAVMEWKFEREAGSISLLLPLLL
ncbi:hypothetical protein HP456_09210 [Bacillus haikouensis]|nr:hypothetical protein [Bacillus haikouensis]